MSCFRSRLGVLAHKNNVYRVWWPALALVAFMSLGCGVETGSVSTAPNNDTTAASEEPASITRRTRGLVALSWGTPELLTVPAQQPIRGYVRVGVTQNGDVSATWAYQNSRFLMVDGRYRLANATSWSAEQFIDSIWTSPTLSTAAGRSSVVMATRWGRTGTTMPVFIGFRCVERLEYVPSAEQFRRHIYHGVRLLRVSWVRLTWFTFTAIVRPPTQPPVYKLRTLNGVIRSGLAGLAESYAAVDLNGAYDVLFGENQDVFHLKGLPGTGFDAAHAFCFRIAKRTRPRLMAWAVRPTRSRWTDRSSNATFVRIDTIGGTITHSLPLTSDLQRSGYRVAVQPTTGQGYTTWTLANGCRRVGAVRQRRKSIL